VNEDGERGAIVNTASLAGIEGQIGQIAYSSSKGGVIGMTLPAARDLAAIGVTVNTVAPGILDTPIYGQGPESEAFKERLAAPVPFPKRLGTADEIGRLVRSLLEISYINGEVVRIDGGLRMPPKKRGGHMADTTGATAEEAVLYEAADGVAVITINRPRAKNAVNAAVAQGIADALDDLDSRDDLTVGIITGAGGTFCSGMDLKAFMKGEVPVVEGRGFAGFAQRPPR